MQKIFLNYRRSEQPELTNAISEHLRAEFSDQIVWQDVIAIDFGMDWQQEITKAVEQCEIMIAIIGPDWLEAKDECGRKKVNSLDDWGRFEIITALRRNIRLIPIMVGGAEMLAIDDLERPMQTLACLQAMVISQDDFHGSLRQLSETLARMMREQDEQSRAAARQEEESRINTEKALEAIRQDPEGFAKAARSLAIGFD